MKIADNLFLSWENTLASIEPIDRNEAPTKIPKVPPTVPSLSEKDALISDSSTVPYPAPKLTL